MELVWVATLRDGMELREDAPPWCDWHAGFDVPWHATACLVARDVARLALVCGTQEVASIDVPVGAQGACERDRLINLRTGEQQLGDIRIGWRSATGERWVRP